MRLYTNIMQYAWALGLRPSSMDEARMLLLKRCAETLKNFPVLHKRGAGRSRKFGGAVHWTQPNCPAWIGAAEWGETLRSDEKFRTKNLKFVMRRNAINSKFESRGQMLMEHHEYMSFEEATKQAYAALCNEATRVADTIRPLWPWKTDTIFVFLQFNADYVGDPKVSAFYDRGGVSLSIPLRSWILPEGIPRSVPEKAIILDVVQAVTGVYFARWAVRKKPSKQLILVSDAFCDGELVAGYKDEDDVRANIETIRTQARVMGVTKALTQ